MAGETGSAREEAERLVAAVLALAGGRGQDENPEGTGATLRDGLGNLGDTLTGMVNQLTGVAGGQDAPPGAAGRHTTYGWATGSRECCVCPVCRLISSMRDPSPHAAERLATGAGDVAMGVASLMRGLSAVTSVVKPATKPTARRSRPASSPPPDPGTTWSAATRTTRDADLEPPPDEEESPWAAATRAEARLAAEARQAAHRAEEARKAAEAREAARRAEEARRAAADPAADSGEPAAAGQPAAAREASPSRPATTAPRPGQDVWAAATSADAADVTAPEAVAHDDAGDEAPDPGDAGRNAETS